MERKALNLRQRVEDLERQAKEAAAALEVYENACNHEFGKTVYDPIIHEAYTTPGDPPGTMGVDWRGPCYVPREEIPRWRRECGVCGLVEYTQQVKEEVTVTKSPRWPEQRR